MILENICDIIFKTVFAFFESIPVMHLDIPDGVMDMFLSFVDMAAYFLPMETVATIFTIIIIEESVKISIALLKLIWKFIPIIGS